jgi:hypothetical protein
MWVDGRLQPVIASNLIHTILDDSGTMVYRQHSKHSDDECLANRQLIACAPSLLVALVILRGKHACGLLTLPAADLERVDAAIAKATGSAT